MDPGGRVVTRSIPTRIPVDAFPGRLHPSRRANSMAVRAHQVALGDLLEESHQGSGPLDEDRDVLLLESPDMVELHGHRVEGSPAIDAGSALQLEQDRAVALPVALAVAPDVRHVLRFILRVPAAVVPRLAVATDLRLLAQPRRTESRLILELLAGGAPVFGRPWTAIRLVRRIDSCNRLRPTLCQSWSCTVVPLRRMFETRRNVQPAITQTLSSDENQNDLIQDDARQGPPPMYPSVCCLPIGTTSRGYQRPTTYGSDYFRISRTLSARWRGDVRLRVSLCCKTNNPDTIRTCGLSIRNALLYPAELRGRVAQIIAGGPPWVEISPHRL